MDPQALSVESANVARQENAWARVRRNWSVRIGGTALAVLVLVALAAPWLGTVDPTLFDAASRDLRPGQAGDEPVLLEVGADPAAQRWTSIPVPYLPEHARAYVQEVTPGGWSTSRTARWSEPDRYTLPSWA